MTFVRWELLGRDVSRAARALIKAPLFTLVSIMVIALALGPNLVIASLLGGLILKPLPFVQPQQLLFVQETDSGNSLSYPDARALGERVHAFADVALSQFDDKTLTGHGRAIALHGGIVSANYFELLGVRPQLGNLLGARAAGVVISDRLWRERFASDPGVLGRPLRLDGHAYVIAGVAPRGFLDPTPFGLIARAYWIAIDPQNAQMTSAGGFNYTGVARIRTGLAVDAAASDVERALEEVTLATPKAPGFYTIHARSVRDVLIGPVRPLLWSLYAAVSLVLLIACANIANLQLSRNAARAGQLAIRSALGATQRRIAAELAAETMLLAAAGGVAGVLLAWLGLTLLAPFVSQLFPRWDDVRLNPFVVGYAVALLAVIGIAAGLLPAMTQRRDIAQSLRVGGGGGERRATSRMHASLVVAEVALAMALAVCAGLVLRSYVALTDVALGFGANDVYVVAAPNLAGPRYEGAAARLQYARQIAHGIAAIPGVSDAASALQAPFECCSSTGVSIPDRSIANVPVLYNPVTPGYFRALRIPLVSGRYLNERDRDGAPYVAVVDKAFALKYFGTLDVLGRRIVHAAAGQSQPTTIVGVAGNVREDFGAPNKPIFYLSADQYPEFQLFVVRTHGRVASLAADIDAVFARTDPSLAAPTVTSYDAIFADHAATARTGVLLFGILAGIALLLALTGVYGVTAYSVERRRREFGVRKALGARTGDVLRAVLGDALRKGVLGVVLGGAIAVLLSQFVATLLYATSPFDPATFGVVTALVLAFVAASALVPAMRAMHADPAAALRSE